MNFLESYLKVMNQIAELLCINNAPGFQGAHGFIDFGPYVILNFNNFRSFPTVYKLLRSSNFFFYEDNITKSTVS